MEIAAIAHEGATMRTCLDIAEGGYTVAARPLDHAATPEILCNTIRYPRNNLQ
jgi:hypothetical protein